MSDTYKTSPQAEIERLLWCLEAGEDFNLYFCHYPSPLQRTQLVAEIFAAFQQPLAEVDLAALQVRYDFSSTAIDQVLQQELRATPSPQAVFIYGLESLLPAAQEQQDQRRRKLQQLNWRRGEFQKLQRSLFFWLPEYALNELAQYAPDFFDWNSGLFEFAPKPERVELPEKAQPLLVAPPQEHLQLPEFEAPGFFGRQAELTQICQSLAQTPRFVISGMGGQGKTYLALAVAQTFIAQGQRAVLVSYSGFQGIDAVSFALSTIGASLQVSLVDTQAAFDALAQQPTLVILDALETLAADDLSALLDTATHWSAQSPHIRLLLTSRQDDMPPLQDVPQLRLAGLARQDALAWFRALPQSKARDAGLPRLSDDSLLGLFAKVAFHPLAIRLLSQQLQQAQADEILALLQQEMETDNPLLASLQLGISGLSASSQEVLPLFSLFNGGAWEPVIRSATGLSPPDWQAVRSELQHHGLFSEEKIPPAHGLFLRFHPALAEALRDRLDATRAAALRTTWQRAYYKLSGFLYHLDFKNPLAARAVARRELPNLLAAVDVALEDKDENAVEFANKVNRFLYFFGLRPEYERLASRAAHAGGARGSQSWFLARFGLGDQLLNAGRAAEAQAARNGCAV